MWHFHQILNQALEHNLLPPVLALVTSPQVQCRCVVLGSYVNAFGAIQVLQNRLQEKRRKSPYILTNDMVCVVCIFVFCSICFVQKSSYWLE